MLTTTTNPLGLLMADIKDDLTLLQVSRELDRSLEQVRRYVREGKLPAHKLGMQWFVKQRDLMAFRLGAKKATQEEVLARARSLRESIKARVGNLHVVDLLDESRESRF